MKLKKTNGHKRGIVDGHVFVDQCQNAVSNTCNSLSHGRAHRLVVNHQHFSVSFSSIASKPPPPQSQREHHLHLLGSSTQLCVLARQSKYIRCFLWQSNSKSKRNISMIVKQTEHDSNTAGKQVEVIFTAFDKHRTYGEEGALTALQEPIIAIRESHGVLLRKTLPYFMLRVCNDSEPSPNTD